MKVRVAGRMLALGAMALLLAGCFKVNMDVEVTPENTISGTAIIAVDENLLRLSGQSADELFRDMDLSDLPAGASVDPYEEDGFVGQEITFQEVSLEDFRGNNSLSGAGAGDELDIVRVGDEFRVSGAIDMSGQEFTDEVPREFLDNFEFRISITFPGEVKSATGDIDGNTVTWEPTIGQNTRVEAVASAIPLCRLSSPVDPAHRAGRARAGRDRVLPHPPEDTHARSRLPRRRNCRARAGTSDARGARSARGADAGRPRRAGGAIPSEDEPPPPSASG